MIKGALGLPRNRVSERALATGKAMNSVTVAIKNMAMPLVAEKYALIRMRYSGTLARQFIMGVMRMVASRAFSSGMALVAITAKSAV